MSQNEEIRQAVNMTVEQTVDAWRQHQAATGQYLGYIFNRLDDMDEKTAGFSLRLEDIIKTYKRDASEPVKKGGEDIERAHQTLSRLLEGATHPDPINGLQKIGEAHAATDEILSGINYTGEAITYDLTEKVEALRAAIRMAKAKIFEPFLGAEGATQLIEKQAVTTDLEVVQHLNIAVEEFELFTDEL